MLSVESQSSNLALLKASGRRGAGWQERVGFPVVSDVVCFILVYFQCFISIFTVQVDEDRRHVQNLTVEQAIEVKKLFVGGAPPEFQPSPLRNIPPFEGCIWNLVINSV